MAFAFDVSAPGTVYVGTLGGRVYRTADAGAHWRSTKAPLSTRVDSLAADPKHPGTLYAGTGVAVYKTVNGGRSWQAWNRGLLPPPPFIAPDQATGTPGWRRGEGWVTALAVDPTESSIVYAGTGGGVKKSTDDGHSWKTVLWHGRFMGISALAITSARPLVVYAASSIEEPTDGGAGGNIRCRLTTLLYRSTNGGKTWLQTGLKQANPRGNFAALTLDPQHPSTLYVAIGSAVLKSTNAGRSWRSVTHGLPNHPVNALAVNPHRSGTVYAAGFDGVYKTIDAGSTWSRAVLTPFSVYTIAVDPSRPATIYAAGAFVNPPRQDQERILRSTDNGHAWATAR